MVAEDYFVVRHTHLAWPMRRIHANLPKFTRIHQALVESARQNDLAMREIDKALSAKRSQAEIELLTTLRQQCAIHKDMYIDTIEAFVKNLM